LLREQFNIGGRVRLHPRPDGILIQPVAGTATAEKVPEKLAEQKRGSERGWKRWLRRLGW
jgi:hypothetical protein